MNEQNEVTTENIPVSEESIPETSESIPADTENVSSSVESGETDDSLEDETVDSSDSLYDKLVEDIADRLKEDAAAGDVGQNETGQDETGNILEDSSTEEENGGMSDEAPVVYVLPENLEGDVSSNDISDILDYLKEREINTSLGMPFSDVLLSDLSVTDGLLLIILIVFLFRWVYDFGRGLFS